MRVLLYSLVIPVCNEEGNIEPIILRLNDLISKPSEIIFVDDGSTDRTADVIMRCAERYPHLPIICHTLPRRTGQTQALRAGIKAAQHGTIATIDGNMKTDPKYIDELVKKFLQGVDMVVGVRHHGLRQDKKPIMTALSKVANTVLAALFRSKVQDISSTFKIFKKQVIDPVPDRLVWKGLHRYLPLVAQFQRNNIGEISIPTTERRAGRSKYTIFKYCELFSDLLHLYMLRAFLN